MLELDPSKLFLSNNGKTVYENALKIIDEHNMHELFDRGVLVGFSGGPDSVMLLAFLSEYRRRNGYFPIVAVHVNHCIRGKEADRDELFSKELAKGLEVEFISRKYDVPLLAKKAGKGLEEAARNVRYQCFEEIIQGRNDVSTIAVAHNSTDNLETVMLNILRGAGIKGASGIPPRRDNIIRPLLYSSKETILSSLQECGFPYVVDSTNLESEYKRNFVRNEILPLMKRVCDRPEQMFRRFSSNLRSDEEFINSEAEKFISKNERITCSALSSLHPSLLLRVLVKITGLSLSESLFLDLKEQLGNDNFSYDLGEGKILFAEHGSIGVRESGNKNEIPRRDISLGITKFNENNAEIILSKDKISKTSLNVYKISIQHDLSNVIINGRLYVRSKKDGDSIFYGGITRKLKKLFSDRKIPPSKRAQIPIICDDSGVVCVPGFGVRDDGVKNKEGSLYLSIGVLDYQENRFYLGSEFLK